MNSILTATALSTLRRCPRQYQYRYELGLTRDRPVTYLRLGAAFHRGLELRSRGATPEAALGDALATYDAPPPDGDEYAWAIERETVHQLLVGHFWRYADTPLTILATERAYELPLRSPQTGARSRTWLLRGKIDALVQLPDGRIAVLEYKTAGEDLGPESDYWLRLRGDPQISEYVLAARALGCDVQTVLYDVTRKPTIGPVQVPRRDEHGQKIVLDAAGQRVFTKQGSPRQTGDSAAGYVLQTDPETPEAFGTRLLADIGDRPDHYFARREVARSDDDLLEFELDRWHQSEQLREMRRHGRWFRNVHRCTCPACDYAGLCLNNVHVEPAAPPSGFVVLNHVHPETEGEQA